ncbi:MAG: hypothetical protein V1887_00260 [Candidatus Aenigmatarchaeota archaeon]
MAKRKLKVQVTSFRHYGYRPVLGSFLVLLIVGAFGILPQVGVANAATLNIALGIGDQSTTSFTSGLMLLSVLLVIIVAFVLLWFTKKREFDKIADTPMPLRRMKSNPWHL